MIPTFITRAAALAGCAAVGVAALTACGTGQISQTADQYAAVDGSGGQTHNKKIAVRDVTVIVDAHHNAALKFTAINEAVDLKSYTLKSIRVSGNPVTLSETPTFKHNCSVVGNSQEQLAAYTSTSGSTDCVTQVATSVVNTGYAPGSNVPVIFDFGDAGNIEVDATVSAPRLPAGEVDRPVPGVKS